jgi:hypothetical protein
MKNELNTCFQQKFAMGSYTVGIGHAGVHGKLVRYVVYSSKRKNWKKIIFFIQAAQTAIDQFLVSRNFRG